MKTVDIINNLIDELRETSVITNVAQSVNTYTFTTDSLESLVVKDEVIFAEFSTTKVYTIKSINTVNSTFSVVSSDDLSTVTVWKSASPYYYYGTPMLVNSWFEKNNKARGLFVFLFTPISEPLDNDVESSIDRNASLEMYFMKHVPSEDWLSVEHSTLIATVTPVVDEFIYQLNNDAQFARPDSISPTNHMDWGTFLQDRGYTERILDYKFSGVGLTTTLPIKYKCQ